MRGPVPVSPALVGRDRELVILRRYLDAAVSGHGRTILMSGEAGIGKTALAEALCHEAAEHGALVLTGRCYDLAQTPPYGPWIELFGRYGDTDGPPLPAAFAARGLLGDVVSRAALFQQVRDFFTALAAARTVVLLLDDLHWADPASLDLLRSLTRDLTAASALVIATYRSDEVDRHHPLSAHLPTLVREAYAERVDLHPLRHEDVRLLVAARYRPSQSDTERLIAYLQQRAEGNPFFLGELLRALEEEGVLCPTADGWSLGDVRHPRIPPLLRQIIDARLARLGDGVCALLGVAAVIGQAVPLALWQAAATADEAALLAAVEAASGAHLLVATPDGMDVRFAHALVREAVYQGLTPARRRLLHRRVGELVAARTAPDPDAAATHFQRAGDPRALEWLLRAGERAERASAWLTAADRFEAAAALLAERGGEEDERGWLLARVARLCRYAYPARAIARLEEAEWIARAGGDHALAAHAVTHRGALGCVAGDFSRGLADLRASIAMREALTETERARLEARARIGVAHLDHTSSAALWLAHAGYFAEARSIAERALAPILSAPVGTPTDGPVHASAAYGLALVHAAMGRADEALRTFAWSREAYLSIGDHYVAGMTALQALICLLRYRPADRAERRRLAATAEAEWARASGALDGLPPRLAHAPLLLVEGGWEEVRALAPAVLGSSRAQWTYVSVVASALARVAGHQGETEMVWALVREWLPEGHETPPGTKRYPEALALQEIAAALADEAGDVPAARAWLEAHDRWVGWGGAVLGRAEGEEGWARYHRHTGDLNEARQHAERALAHATEPLQPLALLAAHRLLGELATEAGRLEDAATHLTESLALADGCAAPYERALTLLALAELRAAVGEADAARASLDEARASFASLGAQPALARARALAGRLAAVPPRANASPAGLTARELEVLRLIAAGKSNREIAQALFLSAATINIHVNHILAKTDSANRTEATAFAFRHGLVSAGGG